MLTKEQHEDDAQKLVAGLDELLREVAPQVPGVFKKRNELVTELRGLLADAREMGARAEAERIRDRLIEFANGGR